MVILKKKKKKYLKTGVSIQTNTFSHERFVKVRAFILLTLSLWC